MKSWVRHWTSAGTLDLNGVGRHLYSYSVIIAISELTMPAVPLSEHVPSCRHTYTIVTIPHIYRDAISSAP